MGGGGGGGGVSAEPAPIPAAAPPPAPEPAPITTDVDVAAATVTDLAADAEDGEAPSSDEVLLRTIAAALPEIDTEDALLNYGNAGLFLQTLRLFAEKMPAMLTEIEDPASLDIKNYEIKAHGLKGVIRGICDTADGALAANLESYAKQHNIEAIHEHNGPFVKRMRFFCDTLGAALNEGKPAGPPPEKSRAKKPDVLLLNDLREAAAQFRVQEMEKLLAEIDEYTYDEDGALVAWLKEKIENLEYTAIVERLADYSPLER